ncbi:glycoside hydrolase family 36 protein [Rhypophila decipiens]|uniref:Glycoside hydrolase family 36 protein n=1 Tax=Rhypophila decipiens TaxID=261697 RepID=A0AAN6YGF3_9PEZI|nr:glycoside hydrolase family 36 protein [Rhypophila decipiens]
MNLKYSDFLQSRDMAAFVATYPPLEQVTQVKRQTVEFQAVLEIPNYLEKEPWEVSLWYSRGGKSTKTDWTEAAFALVDQSHCPVSLHWPSEDDLSRLYFSVQLTQAELPSINFTVKFRQSPEHSWRWVRDEHGLADGLVIIGKPDQKNNTDISLPDLVHDLNPDLKWKPHTSQCPGTQLWSIEVPVEGSRDDKSTFATVPLGIPWGQFVRWFALIRDWSPWLAPRQGKSGFALDRDALLCSFLSSEGKHLVFLGISGPSDVTTLFSSDQSGKLMVHIRNDNPNEKTGTVLVAVGNNFENANAAVMYHARGLGVASTPTAPEQDAGEQQLADEVKAQWYETWYDGLGYCTWNSLGIKLTDEKLLNALDVLAKHNISISTLIIDDNWQDIDYSGSGQWQHRLNNFEAEPKAFPKGLRSLVSDVRSKHKNIQTIAVWHALLGYWGGVSPDGPLARRYKTIELARQDEDAERRNLPLGGKMTVVAKDDVSAFYNDYYRFLSSCGIDAVKTDAQFMMDTWTSASARSTLTRAYLDAWTIASLRHFSNRAISCMSQVPSIIFSSQMPRNRTPVVCRNSDDYFPDSPSSHPWHVWTNAHNALLTQHLNVIPDWDMFQTTDSRQHLSPSYASFHAAARCISGGPVYITDIPGQHDLNLIKQIIGLNPRRNRCVIFRPNVLGKTIEQYANYDDLTLLKVGAYHGRAATGTPILGVFNISNRYLVELLPVGPEYFSGVLDGVYYVVRSHSSGKVLGPVKVGEREKLVTVGLGVAGWDILTAFPMEKFKRGDGKGELYVANMGLLGKMTGAAAILASRYRLQENGRVFVDVLVKALEILGIYISTLPEMEKESSIQEHLMVTMQGQPLPPHTVSVNKVDGHILEVDIETAWKELGLEAGWANEVEVKIYFPL